jgi:short-subunit dehydrogenase
MKCNIKTIFITGASSGIGYALAQAYAQLNTTLLLMGRDLKKLNTIQKLCADHGATVKIARLDVTDQDAMAKQIINWDQENPIDLVIANAGISFKGSETTDDLIRVLDTNLMGTLNTVEPLIPRMQVRQSGQIALLSSLAGFRGMPNARAYSTSKAAIRFYGEALRPVLAQDNIGVSVICPGFVETPLTDKNSFKMPLIMPPDMAANKIILGLRKNKARIAFPFLTYWMVRAMEILPNFITDYFLMRPPKR